MNAISTRSFRSGNSVAVRFPRTLGLPADVPLEITREGDSYRVTPQTDAMTGKERVARMLAEIKALGTEGRLGERLPIEFPEREGWP